MSGVGSPALKAGLEINWPLGTRGRRFCGCCQWWYYSPHQMGVDWINDEILCLRLG